MSNMVTLADDSLCIMIIMMYTASVVRIGLRKCLSVGHRDYARSGNEDAELQRCLSTEYQYNIMKIRPHSKPQTLSEHYYE